MAKYWEMNLDDGTEEIEFHDKDAVAQEDGELNDTIVTYEGNTSDVQSWTDFIASFVNGMKIGKFFKNLYAGIQYVLHVGSLVNNCVTDNSDLPLSAAQGKVLMDELTQVKSDLTELGDSLMDIQYGYIAGIQVEGASQLTVEVTFPREFAGIPYVFLTVVSGSGMYNYGDLLAFVYPTSSTGFTIRCSNSSSSTMTPGFNWIAFY